MANAFWLRLLISIALGVLVKYVSYGGLDHASEEDSLVIAIASFALCFGVLTYKDKNQSKGRDVL